MVNFVAITRQSTTYEGKKLYMKTDDRVKVGDKPMKHTDSRGQELHDRHVQNRKELLKQYKK